MCRHKERTMTDTPYGLRIVLRGNLSEGFRAFGPFNNFDEAAGWCDDNANTLMQDWIITLEEP